MSGLGDRVDWDSLPDDYMGERAAAKEVIRYLDILHELLTLPVPDAFARLLALRGERS